ncbi:MAG TPA: Gfo/Idh/MocA family oxidoreductase [Planctomycetaceae bacterium]|nr:Gfo/Idh/MocA family oxidoreductase [Planctomycetaceae bacterium]
MAMTDKPEVANIAIIGCGRMGRVHAQRLANDSRARLCAFCDQNVSAADALRAEFSSEAPVFDQLRPLLEVPDLHGVVICTPTRFHYEQTLKSLQRGLHVLCEKPLADDRALIRRLVKESQQRRQVLMVGYQRRWWATFRHMKEEIASGRLGRVRAVASHSSEPWQQSIAGTWRADPKMNPGGFIGDAGSHKIDAVFFVTGLQATEVAAEVEFCGSRVEINAKINAQLEGDIPLRMTFHGNAPRYTESLFVHCEKGVLVLHEGKLKQNVGTKIEEIELPEEESGPNALCNPTVGFLDTILEGAPNPAPPECALPVADFLKAVLQSAETEQVVRIAGTETRR